MIKVLMVENDPLASQLFALFLKEHPRYQLVSILTSAVLALSYCERNEVNLILMDICTDLGASGLEVASKLKQTHPEIKIIMITSQPEYDYLKRARAGRIESFWYKTTQELELLEVMDRTWQGESIYPDTTPVVQLGLALSGEFTPREIEVLRELVGGDTNQEIAERLGISSITVRNHIQKLLEKTGFTNRTSLAVAAGKSGLVNREF